MTRFVKLSLLLAAVVAALSTSEAVKVKKPCVCTPAIDVEELCMCTRSLLIILLAVM